MVRHSERAAVPSRLDPALLQRASRWALVATAAAAPAYVIRWHYGPLPTTLLETLILLTVALFALGRWRAGQPLLVRTSYDRWIVLLLLAGVAAVVVAANHRSALGYFKAYLVEPIAIYYAAVVLLAESSARRAVLAGLAASGVVLAVANVVVFTTTPGHPVGIGVIPVAIYNSPNFVAMYLEPLVALSAAFVLFGQEPRQRWLAGALLTVFLAAFSLTFSRGGDLAVAALALLAVLSVRRRLEVLAGVSAIAFLVVFVLPSLAGQVFQVLNAKDPANTNWVYRVNLWRETLKAIYHSPVFGVGLSPAYAHNLWLTFWHQLGFFGLVAFTVVLVGLVRQSWRALAGVPVPDHPILWGIFAGFIMISVHGLVDTPYWKNDMSFEFWLLAGMEVAILASLSSVLARVPAGSSPRPLAAVEAVEK